ncbi:hypothetical protein Hdeb2414_s0018g00528721 [Helianthus debilis subsp. tardiflorus]
MVYILSFVEIKTEADNLLLARGLYVSTFNDIGAINNGTVQYFLE